MINYNGQTIGIDANEFAQALEELRVIFQNKTITWNGQQKLLTTALQETFEIANGKVQLVISDNLPQTTTPNTQYWVKTYNGETLSTGRFIIVTDSLNVATFIGTTETNLDDYLQKTSSPLKLYGTDASGNEKLYSSDELGKADNVTIEKNANQEFQVKDNGITFAKFNSNLTKQSLANDYYFKFSDGTNTYYTKTIVDGNNIDVYTITIVNNKITAITLQESKGTLANGILTFSSVEYAHDIYGDGFYVVGDDEILITISALQGVLEKAGKVNDVKLANKSIVEDKEANIETIDNVEDNFYYAWKNGSNYIYIKSKAIGTNKNTYLFTYTDNVLTNIQLSDKKSEIKLNSSGVLVATYDSNDYTYDTTKDDYYIIDPKYKLPSIDNETRDFTQDELNRIFEDFYVNPNPVKRYTGDDAFVYRTTASAGLTITGDYNSTNAPRTLLVQGKMAHLSFTLKGTATSNSANWTYLGAVPDGLRPKYSLTLLAMCYNGNENDSCGGYITNEGQIVVWCNSKTATNNYQIRVSVSYMIQD